jgi:hypothetical protein
VTGLGFRATSDTGYWRAKIDLGLGDGTRHDSDQIISTPTTTSTISPILSTMAYGKVRGIAKPIGDIPARIYTVETNASDARAAILTVHWDFVAGDEVDTDLAQRLCDDFNE